MVTALCPGICLLRSGNLVRLSGALVPGRASRWRVRGSGGGHALGGQWGNLICSAGFQQMTEEAPTAEVPAGTAGLRAGCCERLTPAPSRGEPPGHPAPPPPTAESGFPLTPGSLTFCPRSVEKRSRDLAWGRTKSLWTWAIWGSKFPRPVPRVLVLATVPHFLRRGTEPTSWFLRKAGLVVVSICFPK